jgi:hypothetical protein
MDALVTLLAIVAVVLVFDALAIFLGHDSRSYGDDDWARPWASSRTS